MLAFRERVIISRSHAFWIFYPLATAYLRRFDTMQIPIDGQQIRTLDDFFQQCSTALGAEILWEHDLDGLHDLLVTGLPKATELVWTSAEASRMALGSEQYSELVDVLENAVHIQRRFGWAGAFAYQLA